MGDTFSSAAVITGASGSITGSNVGAAAETGEPGHYKYNPGPMYPTGSKGSAGPFNTMWFQWVCPATDNYFFSTRDRSGSLQTNFASTCNAFTGSAVNALTRVTTLMDQSVGDGNGTDNGASIAFAATSGTTYYIQIDSRVSGTTGNFLLSWGVFSQTLLGTCGVAGINFDTARQCMGIIQIPGARLRFQPSPRR